MKGDEYITDEEKREALWKCTCANAGTRTDPELHVKHCGYRQWYVHLWAERVRKKIQKDKE